MTRTQSPTYLLSEKNIDRQNACHVARFMINLPHGKERGMYASDGRRVTRTLKNAWVEPDPTSQREAKLPLRSKVGKQGILCHQSSGFATTHARRCPDKNRESLWGVTEYAFPVARCDSVSIGTRHQTAVEPYYLFAFCHMATRNASGLGGNLS